MNQNNPCSVLTFVDKISQLHGKLRTYALKQLECKLYGMLQFQSALSLSSHFPHFFVKISKTLTKWSIEKYCQKYCVFKLQLV